MRVSDERFIEEATAVVKKRVIKAMGGFIAGRIVFGPRGMLGMREDVAQAAKLIEEARLPDTYADEAQKEAETLLQENWVAVEALTHALLDHKELTGKEAVAIIEAHMAR